MQISEVKSQQDEKEFIDFPKRLYKDDPYWVCQLDSELRAVFDPERNYLFKRGDAARWILKDQGGKTAGRIAAFIDRQKSSAGRHLTGGIGFFEVIEDRDAAFMLFDTGKKWLTEHSIEVMDGPVNFGENDNNWGLLVEGFMQQGYGMPYHKKYYRRFFEDYGFRKYYEQYSYHREVRNQKNEIVGFPPRIMKIAEWLSKRPGYSFHHFDFRMKDKFFSDLTEIYNSAWSVFKEDFTPLDPEMLGNSLKKARPILDEELIWFAYFNEKPIAFFILLPDLNQIIKPFRGKLHLWNMIRFLYFRAIHRITRTRAIVGGVIPSHQNSGVESAIFYHIYQVFKRKPWYTELELSWVGDFNTRMIAIYEALGAKRAKMHITYRYLINEKLFFVRYTDEMTQGRPGNKADVKS